MTVRWLAVAGCLVFAHLLSAQTYAPPRAIDRPEPVYPALARQAHIEGSVRLAVAVDRNGAVLAIRLIDGHPLLVKAAMDAVKQWRFLPAIRNGVLVRATVEVSLGFTLGSDRPPGDASNPVVRV